MPVVISQMPTSVHLSRMEFIGIIVIKAAMMENKIMYTPSFNTFSILSVTAASKTSKDSLLPEEEAHTNAFSFRCIVSAANAMIRTGMYVAARTL